MIRPSALPHLKPDAVFIEFAVNDAYLPYTISLADSKRNLDTMVDTMLKANPEAEIVVQTTNPVIDMPDAANRHATNRPRLADYLRRLPRGGAGARIDPHRPLSELAEAAGCRT